MKKTNSSFMAIFSFVIVLSGFFMVQQNTYAAKKCPCDIYKDGATPCVGAHSTVRALYGTYAGPLYQVRRKSDNKTLDITPVTAGGYANAAAIDSFLKGTTGTVSKIYDQSEKKNDLTVSQGGTAKTSPDSETSAIKGKDTLSGNRVYAMYMNPGEGYRINHTNGVATGAQPEGMYMVCSGTRYNSGCCWDYGNAESDASSTNKPTGSMEALYFGSSCWFSPCNGNGPWFLADLEWGLFQGSATNGTTNKSIPFKYVSGFLKGDIQTYAIRANDATRDTLQLMGSSNRPSAWVTNKLTGAIILGTGGDNAPSGYGTFYEGAMTIGRPSDTTENAVQKEISLVYSGKDVVGVHRAAEASFAQPLNARYTQSNGRAIISYFLQDVGRVNVNIFNQQGIRIVSIAHGIKTSGRHEAVWNTRGAPAGVYIWEIEINGQDGGAGRVIVRK